MQLLPILLSLVGTIVARVLFAMGLTMLTLTGVLSAWQSLRDMIIANLGLMPLAALQLAGLLGAWHGLGIVFGAITFAVNYWTLTKAVRLVGIGGS